MNLEIVLPKNLILSAEAIKTLLSQIYYLDENISEAKFADSNIVLNLSKNLTSEESLNVHSGVIKLYEEIALSFKRADDSILDESPGYGDYNRDPHSALTQRRDFIEVAPGLAVYQGELLNLIRRLDQKVRDYAFSLGAIEQEYPTTLPIKSMMSNSYLSNFPQHAIFASHAQSNFEKLKDLAAIAKTAKTDIDSTLLASPQQMLAPTVCYHCFETLKNQKITSGGEVFTALARCHRHEYKTTFGLERLQTFSMREIIFFGEENFVIETRDKIIDFSKKLLSKLGLRWRITAANDPFFANESYKKRSYQSMLGLKQELQLYLPYKDSWLAIGSFNNHRDTLIKAYDVGFEDNSTQLFSGCVGYGYERFALGIFSQFGPDTETWAEELRSSLKRKLLT